MDVLLISEATTRLQKGLFAQKFKPLLVAEAKMRFEKAIQLSLAAPLVDTRSVYSPQRTERRQKLSLGCGPWREKAGKLIRTAALTGKLKVYDETFKLVPPEILALIVPIRSALPDHPTLIYSPPHGSLIDRAHLTRLRQGAILLVKSEFDVWYRAEKAKQKWPSQQKARKRHAEVGRPRTAPIWRKRIIECVEAGRWNAQESIVALRRLLLKYPTHVQVPSDDTLGRIVDALFEELSDDHYRRNKRRPSRKIPNSRNNF